MIEFQPTNPWIQSIRNDVVRQAAHNPMASQAESEEYEDLHVHRVYEQIASHFSSTRYKVYTPRLTVYHHHQTTNSLTSLGPSLSSSYVLSRMDLWDWTLVAVTENI